MDSGIEPIKPLLLLIKIFSKLDKFPIDSGKNPSKLLL